MANIPSRAAERISTALKRFQPIIQSAKTRDVNESDTVVIITDILEHIFGYDKYTEITSEHAIRGTYCDLAVKIDGKLSFLIEAKAIGLDLKEQHVKQAVDYAANQGCEWVCLTNGNEWRVFKIGFGKPITADVVITFNILDLSAKRSEDIGILSLLSKEGWQKSHLEQHHTIQQIVNKFTIGAVILSEPVLDVIRRELRRISSDIKVNEEEIRTMIKNDVIKREVLEGDKAILAAKQVAKAEKKALRKSKDEDVLHETPISIETDEKKVV